MSNSAVFNTFFKVMTDFPENQDFSIFCFNLMKKSSLDVYNDEPNIIQLLQGN